MRKITICILCISLLLCSCQNLGDDSQAIGESLTVGLNSENAPNNPFADHTWEYNPNSNSVSLESIDQLKCFFHEQNFYQNKHNVTATAEFLSEYPDYQRMASKIIAQKTIAVPHHNGEIIPLRDQKGYSVITLFVSELYSQPWVWFHCANGATVKMMYVNTDQYAITDQLSCSAFIKIFAPNAPNVDNYQNFSSYQRIYDWDIALSDRTVRGMVSETNVSKKIIQFLYGDMLVCITGETTLVNDEWLRGFAMQEITIS